jgi:hypothetical protein
MEYVTQDQFRRHKHQGIETSILNDGVRDILMSFETGEQTATKLYFPFAVEIKKIRGIVMKATATTDNGTITGANATGNSTNGVITSVASAALNTEYSVSPTTNNRVGKDSYYKLTSAKTTAGGKILVTLEYTRL